jgi:hypothetical protein
MLTFQNICKYSAAGGGGGRGVTAILQKKEKNEKIKNTMGKEKKYLPGGGGLVSLQF